VAIIGLVAFASATPLVAGDPCCRKCDPCGKKAVCLNKKCEAQGSWNECYYNPAWGMPTALVVPPTASYQTNWGWGVGNTA